MWTLFASIFLVVLVSAGVAWWQRHDRRRQLLSLGAAGILGISLVGTVSLLGAESGTLDPALRMVRIEVLSDSQRKVNRLWIADADTGDTLCYWTGTYPDLKANGYPDSFALKRGHRYFLNSAVSDQELGIASKGTGNWYWGNDTTNPHAPRILANSQRITTLGTDKKGNKALLLTVGADGNLSY